MRTSAARSTVEPSLPAGAKTEPAAATIQVADAALEPVASPARALQARVKSGYADGWEAGAADAEGRWPLYLALPFWVGISALMWIGIIALVWTIGRHL